MPASMPENPLSAPPVEEGAVFWDSENPSGYLNRSGAYKTRVEWDFVQRHMPPAPAQVLDIASGSGRFALRLLKQGGYTLTVTDRHEPSLRLLQKRAGAHPPKAVLGEFLDTKISGTFDAVLAIECLDHIPFREVIRRVHGLLRPGGVFMFTVLNRSSWRFELRRLAGRADKNEHVFHLREYREAWESAGFDALELRGLMWTLLTVTSNSPMVPVFNGLESALGLHAWTSQSPWIMAALRRK